MLLNLKLLLLSGRNRLYITLLIGFIKELRKPSKRVDDTKKSVNY